MQNTTNFNLNKPEGTDVYDIQNENDNMDIIDAALAKSYFTDDSASTELANADYLPFYDTSAGEKKKMLLSTARKDVRARIAESVSNDVMETIGGTALNSYSVGQYFLGNDGYYYVATSAITARSSTISTGVSGNCSKTSIAAGMNSLTSQISNLNSKFNSQTFINSMPYKCTNANTWEYTGLSFTLSNPCIVLVGVSYTECPVTGILVARSSSSTEHVRFSNENSGIGGMNLLGHYYGDTWYIWVKYKNPSKTNNITVVKIISLN